MGNKSDELEKLFPFASTTRAQQVIKAMIELGNARKKVAKKLGMTTGQVDGIITRTQLAAARRGWSPDHDMTHSTPETHYLKGVSTLYGEDGAQRLQWVKTNAVMQDHAVAIKEVAEELLVDVKGRSPAVKCPKTSTEDICEAYIIGDAHIGLLAHAEVSGEDYDSKICADDLTRATKVLVNGATKSKECLICNVGDFYHVNDKKFETPGSGNQLDGDTRFGLIARRGVSLLRDIILEALSKHETVNVINARGNHDPDCAVWLNIAIENYFANQPRVKVLKNAAKMMHFQHGSTSVFVHHGETKRARQHEYITSYYRKEIGKSNNIYGWNGHIHHKQAEEIGGVMFESWNTLTAKDAYHSDNCYNAARNMSRVSLHQDYGEVGRQLCDLRMAREK